MEPPYVDDWDDDDSFVWHWLDGVLIALAFGFGLACGVAGTLAMLGSFK